MEDNEKIYFNPGDMVKIKHKISNRPIMLVIDKVTNPIMVDSNYNRSKRFSDNNKTVLRGIRCVWYNEQGTIQEYIFNTKDLEHVE